MLWLYFGKALVFFKICTVISVYLFRTLVHIGLRRVGVLLTPMLELFAQFKEPVYSTLVEEWLCIKLAPSSAGISFTTQLFGIELAYSHNVLFRLFVGLMGMNPVFLLISLCMSLVFGISSFYYEYSCWSNLSKWSVIT